MFNLVPAFPLDGGRIARAVAWKITGDRHRATRFAACIGDRLRLAPDRRRRRPRVFADGYAFDGIWFAALGWLLASSARGALAQTRFTEQLEGITVADIMDAEPVTIPAALPAARAYEEFFLRYQGWEWFAVVEDDGRYAGIAHRAAVEHAALREGGAMPVRELAAAARRGPGGGRRAARGAARVGAAAPARRAHGRGRRRAGCAAWSRSSRSRARCGRGSRPAAAARVTRSATAD